MDVQAAAEWFGKNPWVIIALGVCTLISLPLGIWGILIGIRATRERRAVYYTNTNNLVRNLVSRIPEVEVKYHGYGSPVENLTVSKVLLVNTGREAIRKTDVVKASPIRIVMSDGAIILGIHILYSNPLNKVTIERAADRTSAAVTFDYLDYKEGFVAEIIHTGEYDKQIAMDGDIINGGKVRRRSQDEKKRMALFRLLLLSGFAMGFVLTPFLKAVNLDVPVLELLPLIIVLAWVIWGEFVSEFSVTGKFKDFRE
jgi:hypothetical protein